MEPACAIGPDKDYLSLRYGIRVTSPEPSLVTLVCHPGSCFP